MKKIKIFLNPPVPPFVKGGNHGFSIAELLVTVVIFSIVSAGVYTTFLVGSRSWQTGRVTTELRQELRKAMDWMREDLRQSGGSSSISGSVVEGAGSPAASVTFQIASSVSGGNIVWSSDIQYVIGGTNSDQLHRITGGVTRIIARDMQSLALSRAAAAPDIVDIVLVAQKNVPGGGTRSLSSTFSIMMRN